MMMVMVMMVIMVMMLQNLAHKVIRQRISSDGQLAKEEGEESPEQ